MPKPHIVIPFKLVDVEEHSSDAHGTIVQEDICDGLNIGLIGYGDYSSVKGEGVIIRLEKSNGHIKLFVWADINQEDPTHIISLEKAKYDN